MRSMIYGNSTLDCRKCPKTHYLANFKMDIKTVSKQDSCFLVLTEDGRTITVPDDFDNADRVRIQEWVDAGNRIEEEQTSGLSNPPGRPPL